MREKMSLDARRELLERVSERYRFARVGEKTQILNQFLVTTGYSRKHAISLLNAPRTERRKKRTRQAPRYDERVRQALIQLWKAANCICSKRLIPFLSELIPAMEHFGHLSLPEDVRERVLKISAATADRLLAPERQEQRRGLSTTRPGSLLKRQIRVRTFADWDNVKPGFFEADLVAHCGESVEGTFLNTLVLVDIASGWTECIALLRRSEADVIGALNAVRQALPFPLLGLDTDNGSEFINYELLRYCREEEITFTRSRPYRKNDQAHVEEKNGSVVRRLIGYDRYEGVEAWRALTELYSALRWYQNFFQPSMKLLKKQRHGGQVRKFYDQAKTPCQRALLLQNISEEQKGVLERAYPTLDPVALLRKIEQLQERFWQYAYVKPGDSIDDVNVNARMHGADDESHTSPIVATVAAQTGRTYPRRYRRTKKPRAPRTWRTREDPFADIWSELRLQLELNPAQTAKDLLQDLQKRRPGQFKDGHLRTLQRRVREWRLQQLYWEDILHRESLQPASDSEAARTLIKVDVAARESRPEEPATLRHRIAGKSMIRGAYPEKKRARLPQETFSGREPYRGYPF